MSYRVKEVFYSIQGEGVRSGQAAVFCRFSGCNRSREKETPLSCPFCDTDFLGTDGPGGGVFDGPQSLADHLVSFWPQDRSGEPYLIFTGGEPALQLDEPLLRAVKEKGFSTAVETNGSLPLPPGLEWITVSPKPGSSLRISQGDELKLLFPIGLDPEDFKKLRFDHFLLQPVSGPDFQASARACYDYILEHPSWRLSLQLHRILNVK